MQIKKKGGGWAGTIATEEQAGRSQGGNHGSVGSVPAAETGRAGRRPSRESEWRRSSGSRSPSVACVYQPSSRYPRWLALPARTLAVGRRLVLALLLQPAVEACGPGAPPRTPAGCCRAFPRSVSRPGTGGVPARGGCSFGMSCHAVQYKMQGSSLATRRCRSDCCI